MSDQVFSPWPFPGHLVAPGSAEVIYLRRALFVLQGRYFNPLTEADAPLPPHRWVLVHSGEVFSEGNDSDADGISTIFEPTMGGPGPDDTWELMLVPLYDGHADSDVYAIHGEAWIDVEAGTWVHGEEIRTGEEPVEYAHHTTRKLLRIPLWSTRRKVEQGGGFVQSCPHSSDFADTGELKTSELQPHGTRADPWVIQVDHGWHRSYIQLRFYDHAARRERAVPQGVILSSRSLLSRAVLGGSSVHLPDGSIYILHQAPDSGLSLLHYRFETPHRCRFRFEDDVFEDGGASAHELMELTPTHYFMPRAWSSHGAEAWQGARDANDDLRQPFRDLRLEGTAAQPLSFHLDDLVPVNNVMRHLPHEGSRIALLDHNLAIRQQCEGDFGLVPYTHLEVTKFPLRAEKAVFVRGEGLEKMTRVFEYDGQLFEVRYEHARGHGNADPLTGARAGEPLTVARDRSKSTVALVDTRYIPITVDGVTGKLAHVIVYVSCFVHAPEEDREAGDADGNGNLAQTEGVPTAEHLLVHSAKQWDQKHPAHGNPDDKKDYVLLPAAGMSEGATVLKIRHFFGSRPALDRAVLDSGSDASQSIAIEVHPQPGRATGGNPMHLYLVYDEQMLAPPLAEHPEDTERPFYFEPTASDTTSDRPDEVQEMRCTIAHELGHSMQFPDEYIERRSPSAELAAELPIFDQSHPGYPYRLAASSLMNSNYLPRLRYAWAHMASLHDYVESVAALPDSHWFRQEQPFYPSCNLGQHGVIRYDLEYTGVGSSARFPDWPIWGEPPVSGSLGCCTASLYPTRRDESLMGPGFTMPTAGILTEAFDGILVITTKLWFSFDDSIEALADRWEVMTDLGAAFNSRQSTPHFYIDTPGASEYAKVLVLIEPRFEYGPQPTVDRDGSPIAKSTANIEIAVRGERGRPRNDFSRTLPRMDLYKNHVGPWIIRCALDHERWAARRNNRALRARDLDVVAQWLGTTLDRGAGTVEGYGP